MPTLLSVTKNASGTPPVQTMLADSQSDGTDDYQFDKFDQYFFL
jgi:hypothetical protein